MAGIETELSELIGDAIAQELADDPLLDPIDDATAQRSTAQQLVRRALVDGQVGDARIMEMSGFSSGNTAMLVARVQSTLSFVVKVDRSSAIVAEAQLLRRIATDPTLPAAIRKAFPAVYAIDDEPPVYGYLMENLEGYAALRTGLIERDERSVSALLTGLWSALLEPAYTATVSTRMLPNVSEDYFERAEQRLMTAASKGLLPKPNSPLRIDAGDTTVDIKGGWGHALRQAGKYLQTVAPAFSTFVHGDPNPENILWREDIDGAVSFRLIDPKHWRTGDYLWDIAKIGHYLRVTAPVEHQGSAVRVRSAGNAHELIYDAANLGWHRSAEADLLGGVRQFAERAAVNDSTGWQERYELAVAANLLGIVGPRLAKASSAGDSRNQELATVAFGEGLRILVKLGCA